MPKESAYTSIKQIPAGFKKFQLGKRNMDYGGGKYDVATNYLKKHGTENLVIDPYNRNKNHNFNVIHDMAITPVQSITLMNVLNVIQSKAERAKVLNTIKVMVDNQDDPVVIIQIYEGDKSGKPSKKTVQTNMKTADYIPEIQKVFPEWEVQRQGNFLIV